jgi:hypothetical protein
MNLKLELDTHSFFTDAPFLARGKLEIIDVLSDFETIFDVSRKINLLFQNSNIGCVVGFAEVDLYVP